MLLRNAQIFCDVVSRRSFSRAAKAWDVTQPAVSQALQQLEDHLGTMLIDRSKRPFVLTAAGETYYEGCRQLFDDFRRLEDQLQGLGDRVAGRVHVSSIYSVGLLEMAKFVDRFRDEYPDVRLDLDYLHPDEVYDCVHRGEADLGIVSFPREGGEIECIPWHDQEMCLVVPPGHSLAGKTCLDWKQLQGERFVSFTSELRIRREIDRRLKRRKVAVSIVHAFDNIEIIKRAVEIGSGVALLPLPTVRREVDAGLLAAVPLPDRDFVRPLGIIHKRQRHLSTAAERFIAVLQAHQALFSTTAGPVAIPEFPAKRPA
jgi:DNA-binding transcriptional LysR family regulator